MRATFAVRHRGVSSRVRRVQRVTITIPAGSASGTVAINAVDLNNCRLKHLGANSSSGSDGSVDPSRFFSRVELTNATTVTAYIYVAEATYGRVIRAEVVEYWPGVLKSVQRGALTMPSTLLTGVANIAAVDFSKAEIDRLGWTTQYGSFSANVMDQEIYLKSATEVESTRTNSAGDPVVLGFQVYEWGG